MNAGPLILKRAALSRSSGEWSDDDYDVLVEGATVGRIMRATAAPVGMPWVWTYGFDLRERPPAHGYERTREAAMAAFKKSWAARMGTDESIRFRQGTLRDAF
jgi:hypothetical protein